MSLENSLRVRHCPLGVPMYIDFPEFIADLEEKHYGYSSWLSYPVIEDVPTEDCGFVEAEKQINPNSKIGAKRCSVCGIICFAKQTKSKSQESIV